MTEYSPEDIQRALSDPEAEQVLRRGITDGSIKLVSQDSQSPVFTRQMSQIGEHGYRAANASPVASELDLSQMEQ